MKPILFLDVDGVLNNMAWLLRDASPRAHLGHHLDPVLVERLERLIQRTGCVIVLSSSWRYSKTPEQMQDRLHFRGAPSARVIGSTPDSGKLIEESGVYHASERGDEIDQWLAEHPTSARELGSARFAIVDDGNDMGALRPRLVQTDHRYGLQDEHVEMLADLLLGVRAVAA